RSDLKPNADPTEHPSYRLFLRRFGRFQRARRTETMLIFAIIVLLCVVSAVSTDFLPSRVAGGVPRIGEYFGKLFSIEPTRGADPVGVLSVHHLFGDAKQPQSIAYWFYRIDVY